MVNKQYGYACKMTTTKNLEHQVATILADYPQSIIFREKSDGTIRPEWDKLKSSMQAGDTCIMESIIYMGTQAAVIAEEYMKLFQSGIELVFIKEGYLDTQIFRTAIQFAGKNKEQDMNSSQNDLSAFLQALLSRQIASAYASVEAKRVNLHRKTSDGLQAAKKAGKQVGRVRGKTYVTKKAIRTKELILKKSKDFNGTLSDKKIMQEAGVRSTAYYKYKRELRTELEHKS